MFWYKLHLFGDVYLSTGPEAVADGEPGRQMGGACVMGVDGACFSPACMPLASQLAVAPASRHGSPTLLTDVRLPVHLLRAVAPTCSAGLRCLQPAVQYISGELAVHEGTVVPLVASHNTVSGRAACCSCEQQAQPRRTAGCCARVARQPRSPRTISLLSVRLILWVTGPYSRTRLLQAVLTAGSCAAMPKYHTSKPGAFGPLSWHLTGLRLPLRLRLPLLAQVRMKFDVESTEVLNLMRPDVSFPHHHFAMLADEGRCKVGLVQGRLLRWGEWCPAKETQCASPHKPIAGFGCALVQAPGRHVPPALLSPLQAYQRAIERAVRAKQRQDGEAHVLDLGCGTGILSLLAARAGTQLIARVALFACMRIWAAALASSHFWPHGQVGAGGSLLLRARCMVLCSCMAHQLGRLCARPGLTCPPSY